MPSQIIFYILWVEYKKSAVSPAFLPPIFGPHSLFLPFTITTLLSHTCKVLQFSISFFACFSLSPCLQGSHLQSSFVQFGPSKFATLLSPFISVNSFFSIPQPGSSLSSSWGNQEVSVSFLSICFLISFFILNYIFWNALILCVNVFIFSFFLHFVFHS